MSSGAAIGSGPDSTIAMLNRSFTTPHLDLAKRPTRQDEINEPERKITMSKKLINVTKGAAAAKEMAAMEKQARSRTASARPKVEPKHPNQMKKGGR